MAQDVERRRRPAAPRVPVPRDGDELLSLRVEDIRDESPDQLLARGRAYVAQYMRVVDQQTILCKNIAATVVALRLQMDDIRGQTGTYRRAVRDMYDDALEGAPEDIAMRVRDNVRYHIGNILRDNVPADELKAADLLPTSPYARIQKARARDHAIVKAVREAEAVQEGEPVSVRATADQLRLASGVANMLGHFDVETITDAMTEGQREALDAKLAEMQEAIRSLRRHTRPRKRRA